MDTDPSCYEHAVVPHGQRESTTRLRISMLEHYRTRGEEAGQVDYRHYCGQLGCCVTLYHVIFDDIIIRREKRLVL